MGEDFRILTAVRFASCFLVLLVPTALMGGTSPIACKCSVTTGRFAERVRLLYGANTAGAMVGVLAAGFYLIGAVGIRASFQIAAATNIGVGAAVILWWRAHGAAPLCAATQREIPREVSADKLSDTARTLILLVFVLSGFASLGMEVVWFRLLVLFLKTTTYSFSLMLAMVLSGIAAGSGLVALLLRRRLDAWGLVTGIELTLPVISLLSLVPLASVYRLIGQSSVLIPHPWLLAALQMFSLSAIAIFPASLLFGMAFPVGLALWHGNGDELPDQTGRRVGLFYSGNVAGAILGSVVAGFGFLPALGSRMSLMVLSGCGLLCGCALITQLGGLSAARRLALACAAIALFIGVALAGPDPFAATLGSRYHGDTLLWHDEGVQNTAAVHQLPGGTRVLYLYGWHQADDSQPMLRCHQLMGHLPMMLHPNPRRVLIIGLGGGATAGAVSLHPGAQVDVVELSTSVVRGSAWFRRANFDVLHRPNVRLRIDDGRNYLLLARQRYDVIAADTIHPIDAGAGNLYSQEYFRLCRNALNEDGLMLQWVPASSCAPHGDLFLRTFLSVFSESTLWMEGSLLVGGKRRLKLDRPAYEQKLNLPGLREALAEVGLASFESLRRLYTAGSDELRRSVAPGPVLTDDRPRIEYFLTLPSLPPE